MKKIIAGAGITLFLGVTLVGCSSPIDRTDTLLQLENAQLYGEELLLGSGAFQTPSDEYETSLRELSVMYNNQENLDDEDFMTNSTSVLEGENSARISYVVPLSEELTSNHIDALASIEAQLERGLVREESPIPLTKEPDSEECRVLFETLSADIVQSLHPSEVIAEAVDCSSTTSAWIEPEKFSGEGF